MHVLLLDQFGEMGGAQFGLLEAATGFAARGWELHALVPEGPLLEKLRPMCRTAESLPCGPFESVRKSRPDILRFAVQLFQQIAAIRRVVKIFSIDVLYVNGPRVLPAAAWAHTGRPVIFHSHSVVQQKGAMWIAGRALKSGNVSVIVSSRFVAGWLKSFVPQDRIQVIYNGVAGFRNARENPLSFTRVGVLGRIAPEKGQLLFIEAAKLAARHNPELRFVICGGPILAGKHYYDLVRDVADDRFTFVDWTKNVAAFFDQIDLLVVPSQRVDANPRVIVEAFAAGVPVIAFDSGGIAELIEDRITGILVHQCNAAALAGEILRAVQRPEHLVELAEQAHATWQRRFTLLRYQSEVSDAVEAVAAGCKFHQREPTRLRA